MHINEYGDKTAPTVVLLAPMMVSGSDLHELMGRRFKGSYHIVAPDQGGHGKAGEYISADDEYAQLKKFLVDNGYTDIRLVYGASLGVALAYRMFLDPAFNVEKAWFDGTALSKNAGFAERFMRRLFKKRKKTHARTHVEASKSLVKMYGYDFARMMTRNFGRITDSDIDAICYACCHYDLRPLTEEQQSRLHLDFGEKDFDLRYARKSISKYMPNVTPTVRKGYAHCGYMAAHPDDYAEEIERFIAND